MHAHNLLLRYHLRGILADHRALLAAPDPADHAWLLTTGLPQVVAETWFRHYAVVPALDPAHRLHTSLVRDEVRRSITTEFLPKSPRLLRGSEQLSEGEYSGRLHPVKLLTTYARGLSHQRSTQLQVRFIRLINPY